MSIEHHKNHLAMGVLTGVTALVGGIEPASALVINPPQSAGFSLTVMDEQDYCGGYDCTPSDEQAGSDSGMWDSTGDGMATASKAFSLFNDLGTTLMLNAVTVTVSTAAESKQKVTLQGTCEPGFDESSGCTTDADNQTTFSAKIDLGGGMVFDLAPTSATLTFEPLLPIGQCADDTGEGCEWTALMEMTAVSLADFSLTITDPTDLQKFVGGGIFNVVPKATLGGGYAYSWGDNDSGGETDNNTNSGMVGAETNWFGTISVTYDYEEKPRNPVPVPATLLLFGAGIAGMGVGLRRQKKA
jgi:hypothetical protein